MTNTNLPSSTTQNIPLPPGWIPPKYQFGQLTKQGWIIGLRYYPEYSELGYKSCRFGWRYAVIENWLADEYEMYEEREIEPYSPEEAREELENEINILNRQLKATQAQIASLTQQIGLVEVRLSAA